MSNFIECSVEIQNLVMSVMEFCLVLEFILILLRMTGSAHLRRKITVTVLFLVTFLGTVLLQCVQKYDAKALEQSLFLNVPIGFMISSISSTLADINSSRVLYLENRIFVTIFTLLSVVCALKTIAINNS